MTIQHSRSTRHSAGQISQGEAQEQSEREFLDHFLAATDQIATWTVKRGAPLPFPDFVLRSQDRVVGVEVTEVYREHSGEGPRRQEIEGLRERITSAAQRIWDSGGGYPAEVWVQFNSSVRLRKAHIQPLGAALAALVGKHLPRLDTVVRLENDDWPRPDWFPEAVDWVTIARLSSHTRSYWQGSDADRVPTLSPEHLQSRIDKKNSRYGAYISQYPNVWLLLVMDSFRHSSSFEVPQGTCEHVYESRFERTYLLDAFGSSVIELVTRLQGI